MGWQDYRNRYEPILYGWKLGADRVHVEDRTETNVWEIDRDAAVNYEHPTQKPVELLERLIRATTEPGDLVADPFAGVASTLVAAVKAGRRAWGCELNDDWHMIGVPRLAGEQEREVA